MAYLQDKNYHYQQQKLHLTPKLVLNRVQFQNLVLQKEKFMDTRTHKLL